MRVPQCCLLAVMVGCAAAGPAQPDARTGEPPDAGPDLHDAPPSPIDAEAIDAALIDASIEARSFTDDDAADFAAASMTAATVEPWGAVAPIAYYTGGLHHRASDTGILTDGVTATWAQVIGFPPTARRGLAWHTDADWGADTPPSVGLTSPDDFTQWWEGEIFLDPGSWTFALLVDDHGFVEIAPPGSDVYGRVVSANWDVESTGVFNATVAAWHPIRYAMTERGGGALLRLRFSGPGVPLQAIPRHRFRARVDDLVGMHQAGFDDFRGVGDVDVTLDQVTPANTDWGAGNPGDLGMTAAEEFSVRWTGQLRIDQGGTFTFRQVSDDGMRLWIDGARLIDLWDGVTHDTTTGAVALAAGWHDVVVEHTELGGGAASFVSVASGPELVGQTFPLDRLRPVEGRGDRIAPGVNHADVAIPDNGQGQLTAALTAPAAATVARVDLTYVVSHTYPADMEVRLIAPNGATAVLRDNTGDGNDYVNAAERYTIDGAFVGVPVHGTWTLRINDTVGADAGTLHDVALTVHYAGGEPPIPATASFESTVRDLGDEPVTSIDALDWGARLPAGSDLAVRVRTCATADACAAAPWSDPVTSPGGAPSVAPARYLQYRIELTSDGDRAPALEWLRVDYRVAN